MPACAAAASAVVGSNVGMVWPGWPWNDSGTSGCTTVSALGSGSWRGAEATGARGAARLLGGVGRREGRCTAWAWAGSATGRAAGAWGRG